MTLGIIGYLKTSVEYVLESPDSGMELANELYYARRQFLKADSEVAVAQELN